MLRNHHFRWQNLTGNALLPPVKRQSRRRNKCGKQLEKKDRKREGGRKCDEMKKRGPGSVGTLELIEMFGTTVTNGEDEFEQRLLTQLQ